MFGESKTIHTVNTRLLGLPDDVGCVPVIRSSSGDVFANHLEMLVSNVAFETGPAANLVVEYGEECYQVRVCEERRDELRGRVYRRYTTLM